MDRPFLDTTDVALWAVQDGFDITLPLVAYYGTNRAWHGETEKPPARERQSRLAGYELDLHLHPRLQRHIVGDLKRVFPSIQFICTTHSPQIIGELPREEVSLLREDGAVRPTVALGADSNWILKHVMEGATAETARARELQDAAEDARLASPEIGRPAWHAPTRSCAAIRRRCVRSRTGSTANKAASAHTQDARSG